MTVIDNAVDEVRERAVDLLNSEGRSLSHVALGVALTAGFALAATLIATRTLEPRRRSLTDLRERTAPVHERPRGPFSLILPAVFSATTLSAVRVWNAPHRPERRNAMGLWMLAQAANALWLALRPASRGLQIFAAMSSAGLAAAFAHEARKLDEAAGKLAAPTGAGVALVNRAEREVAETLH